jgi:hypothetical protein
MYNNIRMGRGYFKSGVIDPNGTTLIKMHDAPLPCTIALRSGSATRAVVMSADGNIETFPLTAKYTSATELVYVIDHPVSHILLIGSPGDPWFMT